MAQNLTDIKARRISFVKRAAVRDPQNPTQPRRFVLFKAEDTKPEKGRDMSETATEINKEDLDPAVRAALEKAEQDAAAAETARAEAVTKTEAAEAKVAELEKAAKPDEPAESKIDKSELSPAVLAIVEKAEQREKDAEARLQKAEEKADRAETAVTKAEDSRQEREMILKAETGDLRGLPGKPADVGAALHRLAKADPEAYAVLEKDVLGPAANQIRTGELFKEAGAAGEGPPADSATAKLNKAVEEIRKSDSSITRTAALERVRKEQPELMREIHDEVGAGSAPAGA